MGRRKILFIASFLFTCTYIQERIAIKNCKFKFKDVQIVKIGLSDIELKTFIEVKNPNKIEVVIERFTYDFYINDINAFSGIFSQKTEIKPGKSKTISMLINIPLSKIKKSVLSLIKEKKADYKIKGRVYLSTILGEFPFDVEIE